MPHIVRNKFQNSGLLFVKFMADGMKARLQRFNLFNVKQEQKDVSDAETLCGFVEVWVAMLSGQLANTD